MRHRNRGRKLGRNPNHQRALLRSLASALILTERDPELFESTDPSAPKAPKVPGRITTTLHKAKEVRPLVERCITIARRVLPKQRAADELEPDVDRHSQEWRQWRQSPEWQAWNQTVAPVVAARRRALKLLGNKEAVQILFEEIAPRMADRDGGYTRILRLAKPRLGDAGAQAILEFVGKNDRTKQRAPKPSFSTAAEEEANDAVTPSDDIEPGGDVAVEETEETATSNEDNVTADSTDAASSDDAPAEAAGEGEEADKT